MDGTTAFQNPSIMGVNVNQEKMSDDTAKMIFDSSESNGRKLDLTNEKLTQIANGIMEITSEIKAMREDLANINSLSPQPNTNKIEETVAPEDSTMDMPSIPEGTVDNTIPELPPQPEMIENVEPVSEENVIPNNEVSPVDEPSIPELQPIENIETPINEVQETKDLQPEDNGVISIDSLLNTVESTPEINNEIQMPTIEETASIAPVVPTALSVEQTTPMVEQAEVQVPTLETPVTIEPVSAEIPTVQPVETQPVMTEQFNNDVQIPTVGVPTTVTPVNPTVLSAEQTTPTIEQTEVQVPTLEVPSSIEQALPKISAVQPVETQAVMTEQINNEIQMPTVEAPVTPVAPVQPAEANTPTNSILNGVEVKQINIPTATGAGKQRAVSVDEVSHNKLLKNDNKDKTLTLAA